MRPSLGRKTIESPHPEDARSAWTRRTRADSPALLDLPSPALIRVLRRSLRRDPPGVLVREPQLPQHLNRMLPQHRRLPPDIRRRPGELHRMLHARILETLRMLPLVDEARAAQVLVLQHLLQRRAA